MSDKLFKQLRDYDRAKPTENVEIGGILGLPVSSQTVEVPGRDGYVYVRIRNTNEIVQAQNEKVSPIFNLPILMKWNRGGYSISGRDTKRYSNWGSSSSFLPKHGGQHSFYGGDPTFIYSRQFVPFATMPSGTNGSDAVYIEPHVYRNPQDGSWNYVGDQFSPNLLTAKPTDSQARMLLLYWDLNSDTVMVATGSAIVASATGTAQILAGLPLLMGQNDIPLAGIRLVSGTSAILWDNIYDVRQFATTTPPSFTGGFAVQDEGSPLGTGTTLNFVGNSVSASVSGSVMQIYVSGSACGIGGVVGQENGVAIGTGTVINFAGDNVDISISGSVVRVFATGSTQFAQYYSAEERTVDAMGNSFLPIELMRHDPYNLMDIVLTGVRSGTSIMFNEPGWYRVATDLYLYPDSAAFFNGNISAKHKTAPYTGTSTFQAREFQYPTQESSQQNWTEITLSETFYAQGQQEIRALITNNTTGTVYSALMSMTIEKLGGRSTP